MSLFDDASLVLTPNGVKSGKVYSIKPTDGVGDFNFTRASSATRVNSDGLIETVSTGVPRLDYPPLGGCPSLLLELQRTNLITYSEEFDNAAWGKVNVTVTANNLISPDGSQNADKLTASVTFAQVQQSYTSVNDADYTLSVFVKAPTSNEIGLRLSSGANDVRRAFNLSTLTIVSMGGNNQELIDEGIENYGNGWYRCYITCKADGTSAFANIYPKNATDGTLQSVYMWGAQLEQGSYATSYIPTSGSTVTRAAETCNGAGDASTFNDSEGVLFAEIAALANENTFRNICISDSSTSDKIQFYYRPDANQITMLITASSVLQSSKTLTLSSALEFNKISIKYKTNDFSLWVNGFELFTQSSGSTPLGLSELAFDDGVGNNDFYGKTKQLITFKQALTDAELEDLTSWDSFSEMATAQLYKLN